MRVCFATDYLPEYHQKGAGAEQACQRVGDVLAREHEIIYLTTKPDKCPEGGRRILEIKTLKEGFLKKVLAKFFPFDPAAYFDSLPLFKKIKPDMLHLHRFNELSLSLAWSAKRLGIPVIFSMYDFWAVCPQGTLLKKSNEGCDSFQGKKCADCLGRNNLWGLAFWLRKKIIDKFFQKIDAVIVLSDSWVDILAKYGVEKKKITVCPLPLFKEEVKDKKNSVEKGSILFTGWVYPHKGLHILIDALPKVFKEAPRAKLRVIESGVDQEYKKGIIKKIEEAGIKKQVTFLGKLPNKQVKDFLRTSQVVAVPEQWGIAWPVFLTEAMFFGKLIVASRIGDIPKFIKDGQNGFLANPKDPNDFALKIIKLLNEKKFQKMGKMAKKDIIEICDESRISQIINKIYQKIC